jgi:uncharacterized protein (TIGR03437 family)
MTSTQAMLGLALTAACLSAADQPMISVVTIETDNVVTYVADTTDPARWGLISGPTTPAATRAFAESITVGDVVSINGRPAKGLWQSRGFSMGYSPTAGPGFAIADSAEGGPGECKWAILTADGILVGRFQEGGLGVHQITGGSGLFLGIRGTQTTVQAMQAPRRASMTEDPSMRRVLGGGTLIHTFYIAPSYPPALAGTDSSPAVYHADFSPVTAASPAHAGEVLIARGMNLGFTTPAVDPGAAFETSAPYDQVNALVEAMVGGQAQDAINKLGWPGQIGLYRVDFRVPQTTPSGMTTLQLRVAGIGGPPVQIPVQ